jgi:hypothetical protein
VEILIMSIEAMKSALEALELHGQQYPHREKSYRLAAITALRQAIEQAEQAQPVGEVLNERGEVDWISFVPPAGALLYTVPLPRQPLTDEDLIECERLADIRHRKHMGSIRGQQLSPAGQFLWHYARAIEAAHGIKENNT